MNVLLFCAFWGRSYTENFCNYSLASLSSDNNIPLSSKEHNIYLQIVAPREEVNFFQKHAIYAYLSQYCSFEFRIIEDYFDLDSEMKEGKYSFITKLQNKSLIWSQEKDIIIFNYADCIWQNGSLYYVIDQMLDQETDALLSLGMPVDEETASHHVERFRQNDLMLNLPRRQCAEFVFDNLHAETALRIWGRDRFTKVPTYVIWPKKPLGAVVRCGHQTIVAMRVKSDDPIYKEGITNGTLDGYFSSVITQNWSCKVLSDTDNFLFFTLFESNRSSELKWRFLFKIFLKKEIRKMEFTQRNLFFTPIIFKFPQYKDGDLNFIVRDSENIFSEFMGSKKVFWRSYTVGIFTEKFMPVIESLIKIPNKKYYLWFMFVRIIRLSILIPFLFIQIFAQYRISSEIKLKNALCYDIRLKS